MRGGVCFSFKPVPPGCGPAGDMRLKKFRLKCSISFYLQHVCDRKIIACVFKGASHLHFEEINHIVLNCTKKIADS